MPNDETSWRARWTCSRPRWPAAQLGDGRLVRAFATAVYRDRRRPFPNGEPMPEAVIVSAARSPIGRANKGSLKDLRPDDLSALIIKTALDKVEGLDPAIVDDVYLGCGLPGGESGYNMARIVNVLNGMDGVPGATVTRYCGSSVQTSRMAFHAIKAGEGDVFVSAGVETVSRFAKGTSDHWPDTKNPLYDDAVARTAKT